MKSYKSFTGVKGGLSVLPTLEERSVDSGTNGEDSDSSSSGSSLSLDEQHANYPSDLLGVSWGSYLNSGPPTRSALHLKQSPRQSPLQEETPQDLTAGGGSGSDLGPRVVGESRGCESEGLAAEDRANEPHPLLQHLEGLMTALVRSKQELTKCGLDVTPLTTLCSATLSSHDDLKQIIRALAKGGVSCNDTVITSDLVHSLVEYLREVLQGLIAQGKKLNVQAAYLQQTARQFNKKHQEELREQRKRQEDIDNTRTRLNVERVCV